MNGKISFYIIDEKAETVNGLGRSRVVACERCEDKVRTDGGRHLVVLCKLGHGDFWLRL